MLLFVCVLHSSDGTYSDSLVSDATGCATALSRSVASCSPDFIPMAAVLRADPAVGGVRFLYSSFVPDTNHAVEAVEMVSAPFSPAFTSGGGGGRPAGLVNAFRGRSGQYVNQCIVEGTRAEAVPAPSTGDADDDGDDDDERPSKRARRQAPTAATPAPVVDPWASLAAGVLTALAFLRKHGAETQDVAAGQSSTANEGASCGGCADGQQEQQQRRNVVVIFSDCVSRGPLAYATECAMAVAALAASKAGTALFVVGAAVGQEQWTSAVTPTSSSDGNGTREGEGEDTRAPGAARLEAMAASVGGSCAARFSYALLSAMLAGQPPSPLETSAPAAAAVMTGARSRRERIADQYVVRPTVLSRQVGYENDDAAGTAGALEQPQSNVGWLCPECMAVVCRAVTEGPGDDEADGPGSVECVYCPYCV